jgi:putative DNA primase/helicase
MTMVKQQHALSGDDVPNGGTGSKDESGGAKPNGAQPNGKAHDAGGDAKPNGKAHDAGGGGAGQNAKPTLAELLAAAAATAGMSSDQRESASAALFARMAMAELSDTAEKEVLKRLKTATGGNIGDIERDYRKVKGANRPAAVSEDKVATLFVEKHGAGLLFCHTRGKWFVFDEKSGVWHPDETRRGFDFARRMARDAAKKGDEKARANAGRAAFASGVERLAQSDQSVAATIGVFDTDPYLLGTPGGVVDLRTGRYVTAGRDARITRMMAVAPSDGAVCPLFLKFLHEAVGGDEAFIEHAQRTLGYALVGENSEQVLVFIHGPGGNGKSVLVKLMTWIFGSYAAVASMDAFTATKGDKHPTDLAKLAGARWVASTETAKGRMWDEQRIKQVTGGEKISARFMRQDEFEYLPQFLPVISGNDRPRFPTVGEAERRRFIVWPFTHKPPEKDRELSNKLQAEGPGILRWLIDGCMKWMAARKAGGDALARPMAVRDATDKYLAEQETLQAWIEEECVVGPKERTAPGALLDRYSAWAMRRGEARLRSPEFKDALEKLGFTRKTVGGKIWWSGIALRGEALSPGQEEPLV